MIERTGPICTSVAKTTSGSNAVLTVQDENGSTNTVELGPGNYYLKETKAGKGYIPDTTRHDLTVKEKETTSVPVTNYPGLDAVALILKKQDATGTVQGNVTLACAEYTVKYYDNQTGTGTPKKTWVFKTDRRFL